MFVQLGRTSRGSREGAAGDPAGTYRDTFHDDSPSSSVHRSILDVEGGRSAAARHVPHPDILNVIDDRDHSPRTHLDMIRSRATDVGIPIIVLDEALFVR